MRAGVCHEFGQPLVVEEVELKPAAAGEVTVRVAACGVCHSDISFMDGAWGGSLPAVFGHEVAGVVDWVGDGVDSLTRGDHVIVTLVRSCGRCFFCTHGQLTQCSGVFAIDEVGPLRLADGRRVMQGLRVAGFAEAVTVHESQVVRIPNQVPLESACLLACAAATGYGAVRNTAGVASGSSVAVIGAGGVGLNAVQGAVLAGAEPVIAVDLADSRLTAARAFGADATVNSNDDVAERVRGMTGGRGADYTFICTGAANAVELAFRVTRRGGTVVIVGIPASGVVTAFDPGEIADSGLRVLGSKMGSMRPAVDVPAMVDLYREGALKLDELVTGRFPLGQLNEAVSASRRGEGLRNVIVF